MKLSVNVPSYTFGIGALETLPKFLKEKFGASERGPVVYFIDQYFRGTDLGERIGAGTKDLLIDVSTTDEPTTELVDEFVEKISKELPCKPAAIVGIGGGITMDTAKAVSNLLTNPGAAEDYQGWDLVKNPGLFKIGIPTISGTGAESSRTCVLTNRKKNIKLGMNSRYSLFDHLILDPSLSRTVHRNQYFYTGMDTYIHCVESLRGVYRHALADSFSTEALRLCREVFNSESMMSDANREKLMVASYLGGASIANTFVGVIHPLSAGLSTVFHLHHCLANCIVMNQAEEFYPDEVDEFRSFVRSQGVELPKVSEALICEDDYAKLYQSMIVHEKPLLNALGPDFKDVLTTTKVSELYSRM